MTSRDPISTQYFNQHGISLELDKGVDDDEFDLLNNVDVIARLTGAPDNSTIKVSGGWETYSGLIFRVYNSAIFEYPSEYALFNDSASGGIGLSLLVDSIYVRKRMRGSGIGTRSVMCSINAARESELRFVALTAAGSAARRHTFFGYHVWPAMGFDAPLPTSVRQRLPANLSLAARLSDLMLTDAGRDWWYDHGVELDTTFDLSNGNVCWVLFDEYAKKKGIRL